MSIKNYIPLMMIRYKAWMVMIRRWNYSTVPSPTAGYELRNIEKRINKAIKLDTHKKI